MKNSKFYELLKKSWRWLAKPKSEKSVIRDWIETIIIAGIMALIIKETIIQAFFIPSSSMEATLLIDDHILVNRLAYKFSEINRHDIIVFRFPHDRDYPYPAYNYLNIYFTPIFINKNLTDLKSLFKYHRARDFIKRAIGLPGDKFEMQEKRVYINNKEDYLKEAIYGTNFISRERDFFGPVYIPKKNDVLKIKDLNLYELFCLEKYLEYKETPFEYNLEILIAGQTLVELTRKYTPNSQMSDSIKHWAESLNELLVQNKDAQISINISNIRINDEFVSEYKILEDCYFALGDNRDNSSDSRFWGYVPRLLIKGKPLIIYWPITRIRIL